MYILPFLPPNFNFSQIPSLYCTSLITSIASCKPSLIKSIIILHQGKKEAKVLDIQYKKKIKQFTDAKSTAEHIGKRRSAENHRQ